MGNTPSRATAKTSRDAATMAMLVFWRGHENIPVSKMREHTMISPRTATTVMKTLPCFPRARA